MLFLFFRSFCRKLGYSVVLETGSAKLNVEVFFFLFPAKGHFFANACFTFTAVLFQSSVFIKAFSLAPTQWCDIF